ncbi:MAG TPA: inorganic diphosphatase [Opitutaceae bacterium]|jgi:inorganic pyrophosphatase|nr:inorganic diphosphatase [Opitutaceae bacterium]
MRLDHLAPFKSRHTIRVVIETPRGSRNKFKFDPKLKAICLSKVLPEGMIFPFDFGFIPRTEGADGDPLDVLVLMDEPACPGCVVECRLIGLMEARQQEGKKNERNDRYVAVATSSLEYKKLHDARELPAHLMEQVESFFVNYNRIEGRKFRPLRMLGPDGASRLARKSLS